jgi:hypothetical protein
MEEMSAMSESRKEPNTVPQGMLYAVFGALIFSSTACYDLIVCSYLREIQMTSKAKESWCQKSLINSKGSVSISGS